MSGRDFKLFLASHKSQIGQQDNRLVTRFLAGHKPLYKPVDYVQLSAITKIKRSAGDRALRKVEKLAQQSKSSREQQELQEHKRIWENEMHRLKQEEEKVIDELESLRPASPNFSVSTTSLEELYEDIIDYEDRLQHNSREFIKNTLQPVLDLHADVQYWLKDHHKQLTIGIHDAKKEISIKEIIESVKQQQNAVIEQLEEEQSLAEEDLHTLYGSIGFNSVDIHLPKIQVGVPKDLLELNCPDESLAVACFQEIEALDDKYVSSIEIMEEKYEDVIRRAPHGGWSEVDNFKFKHIVKQYSEVSKNRRKLYMNRLKKEMPYRTTKQLVRIYCICFYAYPGCLHFLETMEKIQVF